MLSETIITDRCENIQKSRGVYFFNHIAWLNHSLFVIFVPERLARTLLLINKIEKEIYVTDYVITSPAH